MNPIHGCQIAELEWRKAEYHEGPERDGFSICCGSQDYGAANVYCNVVFCPECGEQLRDKSE